MTTQRPAGLREAAQAVPDHMPYHHPGTVCLVEEELRAVLAAATEPGLDVRLLALAMVHEEVDVVGIAALDALEVAQRVADTYATWTDEP